MVCGGEKIKSMRNSLKIIGGPSLIEKDLQ